MTFDEMARAEREYWNFDTFRLASPQIRRLMRSNGWTIKSLAQKMGLTQKRVRHVYRHGTIGHTACEFYEAITGSLSPRMKACYLQMARTELLVSEVEDFKETGWMRRRISRKIRERRATATTQEG